MKSREKPAGSSGTEEKAAKAKVKDSVFTNMFMIPEYRLSLYRVLHPEDEQVTKEQIGLITLKNILVNKPYNDLGFFVGDRLFLLMEQQSTWTENILFRMLFYIADTLQRYFQETNQSLYAEKKVTCPAIELYVLYTGSRKKRPKFLELVDSFYLTRACDINVRVRFLYNGRKQDDILSQYVRFTQICNEQYRSMGRSRQAVLEIIRLCQEQNVLREYLESREKEVIDIMTSILDQEYNVNLYVKMKEKLAMEKGEKRGVQRSQQSVARRLCKKGFSSEEIAEVLDVDCSKVEKWLKKDIVTS